MKGMHCTICREKGPDLVVTVEDVVRARAAASDAGAEKPWRVELSYEFTCGRCGRRWRWKVVATEDGPVTYSLMDRVA